MPNYTRNFVAGGTFFFTVATHGRRPWLCSEAARIALRDAIEKTRRNLPFTIDAWVLLPDHLHCIWTLPPGDIDYPTRWRLIKGHVSRSIGVKDECLSASRIKRQERGLWQRRYWEHTIKDESDLSAYCDYIHYNPVKHGLCSSLQDWPYSTFHRFVKSGDYPADWGFGLNPQSPEGIGED